MEFWKLIVESNTFNFVVLMALAILLIKKLKFNEKIDEAIAKIKETIDRSEAVRQESIEELNANIEKTKNVHLEIEEIEKRGQENLKNIEEKLNKNSENQVISIKQNADKIITSKEKEIVQNLSKKTVLASLEIAKNHVVNLLEKNPEYHQKFIEESIEELNRLK